VIVRTYVTRIAVALGVVASVVAVGAGVRAFGSSRGGGADERPVAQAAADASGASASPGLTGSPSPSAAAPSTPASVPATVPASPSAPPTSAAPKTPATQAACPTGEKQHQVETYLAQLGDAYGTVSVDGQASDTDCATIKKFQTRFGISPANGRAGPTTADVARRIATSSTPDEQAKCNASGRGLTACVDLTQQTVWVVQDGSVIFGPTVVRTGKPGYATPAGTFKIDDRNTKEWSNPYKVWLPYWQHFVGGDGFHQTTTYIHNTAIGSHGCVNLLPADAKTMWNTIGYGTTVKVFGRRAGT
jgi:lipoprotein-anchoring transpeptidase ErfK/SrfK